MNPLPWKKAIYIMTINYLKICAVLGHKNKIFKKINAKILHILSPTDSQQ
jgi:hypothetical protein